MKALAVRPHGVERIRKWLEALLLEQYVVLHTVADPAETSSDSLVLSTMRGLRSDLIVIPFQGSRGGNSRPTDGLQLVEHIRRDVPWARRIPVILQVGIFSQVAFAASLGGRTMEHLFILNEAEFASDALPGKIRDFLRVYEATFRNAA